ncbi:MAG: myo-inositol-1(or 4)-monophosphatase [Rhodobacteraceae bacterium HLUCCA08]|nr:MAG: myo-inositol-1(or 4)-monophosphatase [Rhodobacteraceae bacterium HLUCCA08]
MRDDLTLLLDAANRAADIARRYFRRDPKVWQKHGDAGPVTEADLEIDTMLRQTLTAARPDYGWLSEETADDGARLAHDRVFIVDPIDGTRAFIAGQNDWTHALAVVEHGLVQAAVVHIPERGETYAAARGRGATRNGEALAVSQTTALDGLRVLTGKPTLDPAHWCGPPPAFRRSSRAALTYRMCLVAEGRYDATLSFRPCWEWDIAAGALIVEEAGGTVTNRQGAALRLNAELPQADGLIAAGASHGAITEALA